MIDDPVRLLDEGGSELLHSLLSAAREEQPEGAAMRRTLAAVAAGATLTAVSASASAASAASGTAALGTAATVGTATKGAASSTFVVVLKWLAIGAVTGTVASSAVFSVSGALAPPAQHAAPALASPPASVVPHRAPRVSTAVADLPEIPPPPAIVPTPFAAPPAASEPEADPGAPLSAEVAVLDGARQALKAGDPERALDRLSDYELRFPSARMLPEALYLELEAFTLNGNQSSAEAVARRILRVFPASPHAARARAVLGLNK